MFYPDTDVKKNSGFMGILKKGAKAFAGVVAAASNAVMPKGVMPNPSADSSISNNVFLNTCQSHNKLFKSFQHHIDEPRLTTLANPF